MPENRVFVVEISDRVKVRYRLEEGELAGLIHMGVYIDEQPTMREFLQASLFTSEGELVQWAMWKADKLDISLRLSYVEELWRQNPTSTVLIETREQLRDQLRRIEDAQKAWLREKEMLGEPLYQHLRERGDFAFEEWERSTQMVEEMSQWAKGYVDLGGELRASATEASDQMAAAAADFLARYEAGVVIGREQERYLFYKKGSRRIIAFEGEQFNLKDTKGFQRLARLLGGPGRAYHVTKIDDLSMPGAELSQREMIENDLWIDWFQQQRVVDDEAGTDFINKLERLRDERTEALRRGDAKAVKRIDLEEMFSKSDIRAKRREHAMEVEKVRKRVWKSINDARLKLKEHDPDLFEHLVNSVSLGEWCEYNPHRKILWKTSTEAKK